MKKILHQQEVFDVIKGEREYQDRMVQKNNRPDMVEDLHVGDTLTAIRHNLTKAEEAWYKGSTPHPETMGYLRKVAGLIVQAGENFGMPTRRSEQDRYLSGCSHDLVTGCSLVTCNCK
jgi:hypothetical protein